MVRRLLTSSCKSSLVAGGSIFTTSSTTSSLPLAQRTATAVCASAATRRRRPLPLGSSIQTRDFNVPMPWDGRRQRREDAEMEVISRMEGVMKALDGRLSLSHDTSFHRWLEQHGKGAKDAEPTKEDFQRWLTVAETELGGLAKAQMTVFTGGEWWVEGHGDYTQATRALHCIQLQQLCKELKKSKAVFTPHIPGDRLVKGAMEKVVKILEAHMEGDLETRLKASWDLQDDTAEGKGYLAEQAVEDAIYTTFNPIIATAGLLYPSLPAVTKKAHKKAFAKYIKFYARDHADFPTKIRCLFHWAEQPPETLPTTPPPKPPPKVIDFQGYMATQKENFPEFHQVGGGIMELYKKVRLSHYNQKKEDRETFRTGLVYLVCLGVADGIISNL